MRIFKLKKGSKTRTIFCPSKRESFLLKGMKRKLDWLYLKLGIPESVHGFVYGKNCVTNAKEHVNFNYTISMDLENFFDSIRHYHLEMVPYHILKQCLVRGAPRQGLSTSPTLSNLALREFDLWVEQLCFYNTLWGDKTAYTRYADDITISGDDLASLHTIKRQIIYKLNLMGFKLNQKKTRVQSYKGGRRVITGLAVDNEVNANRQTRRRLRAAIHQNNQDQINGLKGWTSCTAPMVVNWQAQGTIDNPYIAVHYNNYRKCSKTFKGSRAVFFNHLKRSIRSGL